MPDKLPKIRCLTRLESLQVDGIGHRTERESLSGALRALTRLTRLSLRFVYDEPPYDAEEDSDEEDEDSRIVVPWTAAVCRLARLQQLYITAEADPDWDCGGIVRGALPAALSKLTALRDFAVLGMDTHRLYRGSEQPLLPTLPALETALLQLHTRSDAYPGLGRQQQVVLSRVVSLSLGLRFNAVSSALYDSTQLPVIIAPALTELTLAGMWLAPESSELSWLPGLPRLRRLVLTDLDLQSRVLPRGVTACSGLTELMLEGMNVDPSDDAEWDYPCLLRELPAAGPYLNKLVCMSLRKNAFSAVPSCLNAATALELLDLGKQKLLDYDENHGQRVHGLQVLDGLTRLRCVNLEGFRHNGAQLQQFCKAHQSASVIL